MTTLHSKAPPRPSLRMRLREVTLGRLSVIFGISFGVCLVCFVILFLVAMHFFTATESEVPWLYPLFGLVIVIWLVSSLGLVTTAVVALLRRLTRGRAVQ